MTKQMKAANKRLQAVRLRRRCGVADLQAIVKRLGAAPRLRPRPRSSHSVASEFNESFLGKLEELYKSERQGEQTRKW